MIPLAMVPPLCRLMIAIAALLLPQRARKEWKQEWYAELAWRNRSGASLQYMLRSARGAFHDALCLRAQTPFSLRFLAEPLRLELILAAAAAVVCIWNGAVLPPRPPYANMDRLARIGRDLGVLGWYNNSFWSFEVEKWRTSPDVDQIAAYRLQRVGDIRFARISDNFFNVLGVPLAAGRLLAKKDGVNNAIVTDAFSHTRFHSAPAMGRIFYAGGKVYKVIGVLPPRFVFNGCSFFASLGTDPHVFAIALLKPGVRRDKAAEDFIKLALPIMRSVKYEGLRLDPLAARFTICGLLLAAILIVLAAAYPLLRWRRTTLYSCARIAAIVLSLTAIHLATLRASIHTSSVLALFQGWAHLALCSATIYFVLRDQRSRCPACMARLRMPVPIGSWSSLILDRPATEYVCPAGHGALFVSEALHDPNQWTRFDESWKDLFVETTTP